MCNNKAKKRSSNGLLDNRELPVGARQPGVNRELASELLAEDFGCVGLDGFSAVKGIRHVSADECTV